MFKVEWLAVHGLLRAPAERPMIEDDGMPQSLPVTAYIVKQPAYAELSRVAAGSTQIPDQVACLLSHPG
jgi:hypothetical protein